MYDELKTSGYVEVTNNLLSDTTNEYYQIYKNKMSLLKSELNFFQQKERIIDNMIKRK